MAALTRSGIYDIFTEILKKMVEINTAKITNLNILNFIDIQDTQILLKKNNRVYGDLIQTLDLKIYRVVSNIKSQEFDPCAESVFESALIELKRQNDQKENNLILKFDTVESLKKRNILGIE